MRHTFKELRSHMASPLVILLILLRKAVAVKPKRKVTTFRFLLVMLCTLAIVPGDTLVYSQTSQPAQQPSSEDQAAKPEAQAAKIPPDQLDSLVAPIALYPDPLLAQTLAASTYPLEIIQLQQWLQKNSS